ncbi:MAG: carbamoyltransferase HypF [Chloroflexota bacterium]
MKRTTTTTQLARVSVRGVVQGVGFRPFVYQLATRHNLKGWVCNTSGDVKVEVEGEREALDRFISELASLAPPLARIEHIEAGFGPAVGYQGFDIRASQEEGGKYQLVSPDIATCGPCRSEVFSPGDRRYRYPFTNCTNCGPRFTIIEDIPYDRPRTTMRHFTMCPDCQREYDNPLDRRFHAQPNACPRCGPRVELADAEGAVVPCADPVAKAAQLLREGNILAIKGLGGFLLACDATDGEVVGRLRERKRRPFKPLAVMVSDLDTARGHCYVTKEEEALLTSPHSPIVLLRWRPESDVCKAVAPGLKYLGVMLPYTPLHHMLLRDTGLPLVMTSGNLSEEPIAKDNDEASRRLKHIADYFLRHNRDIYSRYDDSVALCEEGEPRILRRARGYAPYPIHLPVHVRQVLACGAELKNTFCLTRENHAFISQHIGDMENAETLEHFQATVDLYRRLFRVQPEAIACDLHPDYLATRYAQQLAEESRLPLVTVQHHHAHIASCLAEHGVLDAVIGVSFDGTGYGSDGRIWGGEFLVADCRGFERAGHLEYVPMPGGAAAIERPYRMALGYLLSLLDKEALELPLPFLKKIDEAELAVVKVQVERGLNSPLTSSSGRLFDAVSALLGIRDRAEYEAQAAIEMEMIATDAATAAAGESYPFSIETEGNKEIVKLAPLFAALVADLQRGVPADRMAARFHHTVAEIIRKMCHRIAERTGIHRVALSGGVFQNRLLTGLVTASLKEDGFSILSHRKVPCNDGGISLGQAVVANFAERSP